MKRITIEDFSEVMEDTIYRFEKSHKSQNNFWKKETSFAPQSANWWVGNLFLRDGTEIKQSSACGYAPPQELVCNSFSCHLASLKSSGILEGWGIACPRWLIVWQKTGKESVWGLYLFYKIWGWRLCLAYQRYCEKIYICLWNHTSAWA